MSPIRVPAPASAPLNASLTVPMTTAMKNDVKSVSAQQNISMAEYVRRLIAAELNL